KHLDDIVLCGETRLASDSCIILGAAFGGDPFGRFASKTSVAANERARWQLQLAPPSDVILVAESTHHRNTGALIGLGQFVWVDLNFNIKQRRGYGLAEKMLIAVVVGMRDQT